MADSEAQRALLDDDTRTVVDTPPSSAGAIPAPPHLLALTEPRVRKATKRRTLSPLRFCVGLLVVFGVICGAAAG